MQCMIYELPSWASRASVQPMIIMQLFLYSLNSSCGILGGWFFVLYKLFVKNTHVWKLLCVAKWEYVFWYQVSFIDSWFLCLSPIKQLLLRFMRKSNDGDKDTLQRHIVYSFGDHYYFRKELKILNLLTGYSKFLIS